ncbi:hypothetical protein TUN205_11296 [Pyrenophora tritici-repentis]|nr:hypothetical protein TUN205_11296 [Pyrenophora tritici-repentis]KAI1522083.1 hypothetical protein PtrSN001C_011985 [Pyrenophora tritici-repentis]KAI1559267.1 hypothetical protein PtrEW7m1_011946 [Pyrenophora tritici-repentis]KAI1666431.1 hypothetical protein L13192_10115 [Pyrenophora tritici-repentis]PWO19595.1 hypothetical protein PtrARCrB10_11903 [Pyrenophora tritici-repentis]
MSSGQTSSSSGSKREIKRQPVTDLPEQRSDTSEFLSFRPEIPPPTTPQKSKRPTLSVPDYDVRRCLSKVLAHLGEQGYQPHS